MQPTTQQLSRTKQFFVFSIGLVLGMPGAQMALQAKDISHQDQQVQIDVSSIPEQERVTINGLVLDENGTPISGAKVVLEYAWKKGRSTTVTDADGKFSFLGQRKHLRLASVKAAMAENELLGFARVPYDDTRIGKTPLEIKLAMPKIVKAIVVDKDNQPLADAEVGFLSGSILAGVATSGVDGSASLQISQNVTVDTVFALSSGHGFDYRMFRPGRFRGDRKQKARGVPEEPVELKLAGAAPVTIRLIDEEGLPIQEADVYPWLLKKPSENDKFNVSFVGMRLGTSMHQETNMNGEAVFNWFPSWQKERTSFWPTIEGYVRHQQLFDRKAVGDEFTVTLKKRVTISGRVEMSDGMPCPGASVIVVGQENGRERFQSEVTTDAEGRYEIFADPEMVYLVVAKFKSKDGKHYASAKKDGFALWPKNPVTDLNLKLRPATRVFGTVIDKESKEPVPNHNVRLRLIGQSAKDAGIELPKREKHSLSARPGHSINRSTDSNGKFEFWAGDGRFQLSANSNESAGLRVKGETDIKLDFKIEVAKTQIFKGLVLDRANGEPVPEAVLNIVYASMEVNRIYSLAKTDEDGKFAFERSLHPIVVKVTNKDGTKSTIFEADTKRNGAILRIDPMSTAVGVLIDNRTGLPSSGVKLSYGYRIDLGGGLTTTRFGGTATTNENGEFELKHLIVGRECIVSLPASKKGRVKRATTITPTDSEKIELGNLQVDFAKE